VEYIPEVIGVNLEALRKEINELDNSVDELEDSEGPIIVEGPTTVIEKTIYIADYIAKVKNRVYLRNSSNGSIIMVMGIDDIVPVYGPPFPKDTRGVVINGGWVYTSQDKSMYCAKNYLEIVCEN